MNYDLQLILLQLYVSIICRNTNSTVETLHRDSHLRCNRRPIDPTLLA